ncbi:MAG: hypothetical protein O7E54_01175 [Planctomycetota bacterium]|nr:hypothetical protein [Planctomycetota bacterium]
MKTMLALLLASTATLAQATDFETRYHEAYVLEVIDGKTADAAKRYLELAREKGLPAHLLAQCRFRFAVTCVLLGRADEARARLAVLAADPSLPAALKPQVAEYRKGIKDVGTGSALQKRLDDLVFELGRAHSGAAHPRVYRDFQIIGKPAVPRLKQLLNHPDRGLQVHAFRLLCQMDEPGLSALWRSVWFMDAVARDLARYLIQNPREVPAMERGLRKPNVHYLDRWLPHLSGVHTLSLDTLDSWARKDDRLGEVVGSLIRARPRDDGVRGLLTRWMTQGPDRLALEAAVIYAEICADKEVVEKFASPELFPVLCRRLRSLKPSQPMSDGVEAYARRMPPQVLLEVLAALVATKDDPALKAKPLRSGLADIVASALDARATKAEDIARYVGLLRQWLAWLETFQVPLPKENAARLASHLRFAVTHLKPAEAVALTREIFAKAKAVPGRAGRFVDVLGFERAEDVPLILAALEVSRGDGRRALLGAVDARTRGVRDKRAYATAMARAYPEVVRLAGPEADDMMYACRALAVLVTPKEAVQMIVDVFRAAQPLPSAMRTAMVKILYADVAGLTQEEEPRFWRHAAVPAIAGIWGFLDPDTRSQLVYLALNVLSPGPFLPTRIGKRDPLIDLGETRKDLAAVLRPRLHQLRGSAGYKLVAAMPDLFPIEEWLPKTHSAIVRHFVSYVPQDAAVRAARHFAEKPAQANEAVLEFINRRLTGDTRREVATRLYEQADAALLAGLVRRPGMGPTRPETLERALTRFLADKDAKLADLSKLGSMLALWQPSEKLFPLVRRLLTATDAALVKAGITMARGLGREELVPDLLKKLDSMHADLRSKARTAIDSILELRRIKEEVRRRTGHKK